MTLSSFIWLHGFQTGIWVNAFGHGSALSHETSQAVQPSFTQMTGVYGESFGYADCPLDPHFTSAYCSAIQKIAAFCPDIIMLDDDFRLNLRGYYMGCFCPYHLEAFYQRIGERIPREKLEHLIFTGGPNKYRSEFMKLSGESLLDFAKALRKAVDAINPVIRLTACACYDNWDFCGTDQIELTLAFAGNTKPLLRTIGAPYWDTNIIEVLENTRMQADWCNGLNIELFSEGDVYPRPRYQVSSKVLELFDLALLADGSMDGILKYMYDYNIKPGYETGYADRHVHNESLREQIKELFLEKHAVGVTPVNILHKIENWHLPDTLPEEGKERIATKLIRSYRSVSASLLSKNSIPTVHSSSSDAEVLFLCGENARYLTKQMLGKGAILDTTAARILMEAGIDTGLLSAEPCHFSQEYFIQEDDTIRNIDNGSLQRICCARSANIVSVFHQGNCEDSPASYLYENEDGQRFYVLAYDFYNSTENVNYTNNYYRQAHLIRAIEWIGKKKLPAVCTKNPGLYLLAAVNSPRTDTGNQSHTSMAVALCNVHLDDILQPQIILDKPYSKIRCINCTGVLEGDKVYLSQIPPYGFAAFEVTV